MTRAVILPHFGDPLTLHYWLLWFKKVWHEEVDALYVMTSNNLNANTRNAIIEMLQETEQVFNRPGLPSRKVINLEIEDAPIQHGDAINKALDLVKEDLVMLVEEDTVIFKPGHVDSAFKIIEDGDADMVGSARGSCDERINEASKKKYGELKLPDGSFDNNYNFWPNFFFIRKSDLLRTDRNFNARIWEKGESIPELGIFDIVDPITSDTFVNTSIQLRALGLKIAYVEQYHGHPDDMDHFRKQKNVFDGKAGWVHHGSLSGWKSLFNEEHAKIEGLDPNEVARRMQWYLTFVEAWRRHYPEKLKTFVADYEQGVRKIMQLYGVSENTIQKRQLIYNKIFGVTP